MAWSVEGDYYMLEGHWKLGLLIDDSASEEQAEAFGIAFGGGGKSAFSHHFAWSA